MSIGGDSSQDEAEEEAKAITVNTCFLLLGKLPSARAYVHVNVVLQVRFSRPESEQARQRRIQSYEFLQKKQAEEPWVHLQYHSAKVGGLHHGGSKSFASASTFVVTSSASGGSKQQQQA